MKIKPFIGILTTLFLTATCSLFANYEDFTATLAQVGINVQKLQQQPTVSRFEMARLLNAINCENCITPPARMIQRYDQDFRQTFSSLPNRDFNDISFEEARRQQQSYYYCVAYVGDREYMRGYPAATSPLCGGQFCGQNSITKPEFFQAILNIINIRILPNYQANRSDIQKRLTNLKTDSYQYQVLFEKDKQAIKDANTTSRTITTTNEFQAYLKYCMFNLDACGFQAFGEIKQGFWPVSELNVLFKEGILTREDTTNIYGSLNGKDALSILYYVFQ